MSETVFCFYHNDENAQDLIHTWEIFSQGILFIYEKYDSSPTVCRVNPETYKKLIYHQITQDSIRHLILDNELETLPDQTEVGFLLNEHGFNILVSAEGQVHITTIVQSNTIMPDFFLLNITEPGNLF